MHEQLLSRIRELHTVVIDEPLVVSGMFNMFNVSTDTNIPSGVLWSPPIMTSGYYYTVPIPIDFIRVDVLLVEADSEQMPSPHEELDLVPPLRILEPVPLVDLSWDE